LDVEHYYGIKANFTEVLEFIKETPAFGLVVENSRLHSKFPKKRISCHLKQIFQNNSTSVFVALIGTILLAYIIKEIQ
jgi:hypothetical protein